MPDEESPKYTGALNDVIFLSDCIQKFTVNLKKTNTSRINESFLLTRLDLLNDYWRQFRDANGKLNRAVSSEERNKIPYYVDDGFSLVEDWFMEASMYIKQKQLDAGPKATTSSSRSSSSTSDASHSDTHPQFIIQNTKLPRLPPVTIPKFNGDYKSWPSFHDMFKTLVHENKDISSVHKLHYLKSSLVDEPANMLRNIQITELNYDGAWQQLVRRYNNKRVLVNSHISTIFDQPKMRVDTAVGIKQLLDVTSESLNSLNNLDIDTSTWDCLIVHIIVQRLSAETRQLWEQNQGASTELPIYEDLQKFLEARYRTLEVIHSDVKTHARNTSTAQGRHFNKISYHTSSAGQQAHSAACVVCKGEHSIRNCDEFKSKGPSARFVIAKQHHLCTNCLSKGHFASRCSSSVRCQHCQKRHHTMLHSFNVESSTHFPSTSTQSTSHSLQIASSSNTPDLPRDVSSFHVGGFKSHSILLATALVQITSDSGNEVIARALLDPGSECSFITEALARRLNLKFKPIHVGVTGIGNETTTSRAEVEFTINAHFQQKLDLRMSSFVLRSLAGIIPQTKSTLSSWEHTRDLKLADPGFATPGPIDLLLGVDIYNHILMDGIRKGPQCTPMAQKTRLGWVLSGKYQAESSIKSTPQNIKVISCVVRVSLEDQLKQFWELEEIPAKNRLTQEEELCDKIFQENYKRTDTGRFVVKLPFVPNYGTEISLGHSRHIAVSRYYMLEKRLNKNQSLQADYSNVIKEYLDLNHMEQVEPNKITKDSLDECNLNINNHCYIPHHAVIKETSSTTKTRVVFDASRPTSSGKSLNDCLLNGPLLQEDILSITLRWRKHKIAITSDIKKMYRQIRVTKADADMQRIIWRWEPNAPLRDYRLLTLTFGTKSASFLAIKCIQTIAEIERVNYPIAADTIINDFYVDDLLSGSDNVEDAIEKRRQVKTVLSKGGFDLTKWSSNDQTFMEVIPEHDRETKDLLEFNDDNAIKTLGLYWHPTTDLFQFKITLELVQNVLTKRSILSDIAKIYDPHGWLAPITIRAKILLQSLWLTKLGWDDELPSGIVEKWLDYRVGLWSIESIRIPRWINVKSKIENIQFHCFTDASIHAYAAAVYIRVVDENGTVYINLLAAKTKVAPVKQVSLPRLELCGVALGAKLIHLVIEALKIPTYKIFGWTDSSIVLAWLQGHPNRWKPFVANRVSDVQRMSDKTIWRHVPTKDNPADCASRGIAPHELRTHHLWWQGPSWLKASEHAWPILNYIEATDLEERTIKSFNTLVNLQPSDAQAILVRFSTYTRLIRISAYVFRFIKNARRKSEVTGNLTTVELNDSLLYWIKYVQGQVYSTIIFELSSGRALNNHEKLLSLNPIIDDQGILRVGGRLEHTHFNYAAKHPIILPNKHHFTALIINNYHRITMHGGPQIISGLIRKKYWIVDARNSIRNQISKCVTCRRYQAKIRSQLMGQLPISRITTSRPFQNVGIDYAGPFDIKQQKGRGSKFFKGYICLFICMSVKAIHLELVSELTTQGFLAAFRRFVSRRGLCSTVHSDNGTNFVGASRLISKDFARAQIESEMSKLLINDGIEWKFIPPGAPNFGGLWEAGIKATKYHLKRVLGNSHLTFEEFSTVLTQIEGVLNSRPLCPLTSDPSDLEALTPGHFLIGDAILTTPEPNLLDINMNRLDRWQRLQQLFQSFWKRWNLEYVSRLQQRPKWMKPVANLAKDDMVLVKQDNLPPSKWMLGRVVETHPGHDQIVRVVSVRTCNGVTKKAVSKICVLPI